MNETIEGGEGGGASLIERSVEGERRGLGVRGHHHEVARGQAEEADQARVGAKEEDEEEDQEEDSFLHSHSLPSQYLHLRPPMSSFEDVVEIEEGLFASGRQREDAAAAMRQVLGLKRFPPPFLPLLSDPTLLLFLQIQE